MSINTKIRDDAANFLLDEDEREVRLWVIYASSQTVGLGGAPLQQIPVDLVEDTPDKGALAQALVDASELYTNADGWIIEHVDSDAVPAYDLKKLAERLGDVDCWDEFICLPEGACHVCGGSGVISMDCCDDACIPYALVGDCEDCDGTGNS